MVQSNSSLFLRKLRIDHKEFVTESELKTYCRSFKLEYSYITRYLMRKGVLIRIFRGIFYLKSTMEIETGVQQYSHLDLVSKGLDLKGIGDWYFGLYTALKINKMTHEYFTLESVLSGELLRVFPMKIAGHKFQFTKIRPKLTRFGIKRMKSKIKSTSIKYSDPEKTILDFIYLWRYDGISQRKIQMDIKDWIVEVDTQNIKRYSMRYPKTVQKIILEVLK